MDKETTIFAQVAGLYKVVKAKLELLDDKTYAEEEDVIPHYRRYAWILESLQNTLPDLFSALEMRDVPTSNSAGYVEKAALQRLFDDLDYILEVRANSNPGTPQNELSFSPQKPTTVFLSHGRSLLWREVQDYIERDLKIATLELAQEPNRGRTVLQKLAEESGKCSYAVVVMTGDDDVPGERPRARENVIHEIGFFQGKYGLANVCLLYEEGTNIPSNIHGLVYIPFPPGMISAGFGALTRELRVLSND